MASRADSFLSDHDYYSDNDNEDGEHMKEDANGDFSGKQKRAKYREEIRKKIEKWQEPPLTKQPKQLPVPDSEPNKKRSRHHLSEIKEKKVPVNVFIADDRKHATCIVTGICWNLIPHAKTSQEAGALFASIIGAFSPDLLIPMIEPLQKAGAKINTLYVPTDSETAGYHFDLKDSKSYVEYVIFFGLSLMLPFKHITDYNYHNFIKARLKAMGGRLGIDDSRLKNLKYPLDVTRAKMVNQVFGRNMEFKREVLKYLMWASDQTGLLQEMARYASMILSWNELSLIVFIKDALVASNSPVLQHASLKDEVDNLFKALDHIGRSKFPQYFRYFCTRSEEKLIQRRNFQTLGAVAIEILNKLKNKRIANYAGTSKTGGALVKELVDIHMKYCEEGMVSENNKIIKFLFDDGDFDKLLDEEEEDDVCYA